MISKILFFIWFGSEIPAYGKFSIQNFKLSNPDFTIKIYNEIDVFKSTNDDIQEFLSILKYDNFYSRILKRNWANIHLRSTTSGINALLSDSFRFYLLNKYGGIYLDLDTFPVKPFDNKLLSYENGFAVKMSKKYIDIFFIGMPKDCIKNNLVTINKIGENHTFNNNIHKLVYPLKIIKQLPKYQYLKNEFINCNIQTHFLNYRYYDECYIDHYYISSWSN